MTIHSGRILYEDDALLAVNKLPRELVVRGKGAVGKLPLLDFLRKNYPGIHPLNRLDFETSGIVLFARNRKILEKVVEGGFRDWRKAYRALVMGRMEHVRGEITFPLKARTGGTVPARTRYRVLETFERVSLVEAEIETGRHHQIRQHFAMLKHPLVLDYVYGDKTFNHGFTQKYRYRDFFLHAASVEFPHPITGKRVKVEAPLPQAFEEVLERLREN